MIFLKYALKVDLRVYYDLYDLTFNLFPRNVPFTCFYIKNPKKSRFLLNFIPITSKYLVCLNSHQHVLLGKNVRTRNDIENQLLFWP